MHPGIAFLPPADILTYPSLPSSVLGQIGPGGDYYDFYGKYGAAYDSDTLIDAPTGEAKTDYEAWLNRDSDIAQEINAKVNANYHSRCGSAAEDAEDRELLKSVSGINGGDFKKLVKSSHQTLMNIKIEGGTIYNTKVEYLSDDELADLLMYKSEDWEPGPSEKADRYVMI